MHPEITRATGRQEILALSAECSQCGHCCSFGSGFVLDEEISGMAEKLGMDEESFRAECLEKIAKFNTTLHRLKLKRKKGVPYGECIFLSQERKCSIHSFKPLHCRIASCRPHGEQANEWFIANYFVRPENPESIRQWCSRLRIKASIKGAEPGSLVPEKEIRDKMLSGEL